MLGYAEIFIAILSFLFLHLWRCNRNRNSLFTNWPILGMLPSVLYNSSNLHDYLTHALKQHGGTGEFKGPWFTNMKCLITCDPLNAYHIFVKHFSNYDKGPEYHEIFEAFGDGVFSADGETWKRSRAVAQLMFKEKNFDLLLERAVQKKAQNCLLPLLDHISKQGMVVDLQDVFNRLTFDTNSSKVMGVDPNSLSIHFPQVACQIAFDQMVIGWLYRHLVPRSFWKIQKWLQIGQEKKMTRACQTFENFLRESIASKREEQTKCTSNDAEELHADLLTELIRDEKSTGKVDDKFLRDTAFNLFVAGRDGIAVGLTWFFWLVATHPLVEAKIIEEINEMFQPQERNLMVFGVKEVKKLVYLHAAMCEALGLFPPLPFERKHAVQSDILPSGHLIKRNEMIVCSLYSMGKSEEIWGKDCLEFKPERWISKKREILHVPSYKYMTFNAGPRVCLGKDLSIIEMKMVASSILWSYRIEVMEGQHISPSISLGLLMKYGLKVHVGKRDL
ncbi:hypothetical protein L6164_005605 [Bauhinia variegata]|nr:hypothetical protein L6164_005605 [Bauhinia variegata]